MIARIAGARDLAAEARRDVRDAERLARSTCVSRSLVSVFCSGGVSFLSRIWKFW